MNYVILVFLVSMIPSVLCVIAAVYLAAKDKEGWGWFLFVALIIGSSAIGASDIFDYVKQHEQPNNAQVDRHALE